MIIENDEQLNLVAKKALETELSGKYSLERLASQDDFLRHHEVFHKLNSYLQAFDMYQSDYQKYISTHKCGEPVVHRFRNFEAEWKLHASLKSMLEKVIV